jgi:hypothetical protein
MRVEIKRRWTGAILFAGEYADVRTAAEAAARQHANLSGADLRYADLRSANLSAADLRSANLSGADLRSADLRYANLSGADLRYADLRSANLSAADLSAADLRSANLSAADLRSANLSGADLRSADLRSADLSGADLRYADLRSANLSAADLSAADLRYANLRSADLRYAKNINPHQCTPLLMLLDQPGKQRAYKVVKSDGYGIYFGPNEGGICYEIGGQYRVADANTDCTEDCGAGVNLATLDWCMREWQPGYRILIAEFTAKDIAAIPTATDGKFRVHRCKIVGEKDLTEIGLVQPEDHRRSGDED